ncbi:hypothetical protein FNV43_RR04309 [Rhamnella rubrinervis]|uniref:CRAL-TRIO domain-containing protein n=1 Tax=Rhamnella rubrinervis TaxID=2594499 RepID=A0A8K0HLN6_9ROSA|nr:hypothetical protein FNV43_RR04309 [Rhamnella rubrinervis]
MPSHTWSPCMSCFCLILPRGNGAETSEFWPSASLGPLEASFLGRVRIESSLKPNSPCLILPSHTADVRMPNSYGTSIVDALSLKVGIENLVRIGGVEIQTAGDLLSQDLTKRCSVAPLPKASSQPFFRRLASLTHSRTANDAVGHVALFILKVAALETVRRFSRAKCPFAWRSIQALQILCYPPFKWIQRVASFRSLAKGVQMFSRPLLVISIATAFSEQPESNDGFSDGASDSNACSEVHSEESSLQAALDTRVSDESPPSVASEVWLIELHKELEKQGISLPERINDDDLRRFYTAANSVFSCFLSSVKNTIRWRETYRILTVQELEMWSNMVFWHGCDVKHRPCLIVRLGLACSSLPPPDRPRFAQAVISNVEHGVLHLVDPENPQITVLVDCEGLSPLKVPMQIIKTCSSLLQDHFPNRLGCLFVIRLPPVLRIIAQTFIQVLKPVTRKKLKIEGQMYQKVLSEYLQTLPLYLGGKCTCRKCSETSLGYMQQFRMNGISETDATASFCEGQNSFTLDPTYEDGEDLNCDQVLKTAIISILMLWVFIAFIAGICDPETRPFFT